MSDATTQKSSCFINVDLEVSSSGPLDDFVEGMGKSVMVLYAAKEGRRYLANLELAASGYGQSADRLIRRFVTLIRKLPAPGKTAWEKASSRIFDLGVRAEARPNGVSLEQATVEAIASIGARLAITIYPREETQRIPTRRTSS
jgi:hypothetical protein